MTGAVIGRDGETALKEESMDNPFTCDDFFDSLFANPYDCTDAIPESVNMLENSDADKSNSSTSIAINFSEIMADLVNLVSLDKALALHDNMTGFVSSKPADEDAQHNNGKRPHDDDEIFDICTSYALPDHNYSSQNLKKQKVDDGPTTESSPLTEHKQQGVKGSKYVERRKKNNIASKRSRESRKNRFCEMEIQADQLEQDNERLRERIAKLEKLTQEMKEILISKLTKAR